jgi:TRAP-type C4-dicarboxylate transport system permease small subunit
MRAIRACLFFLGTVVPAVLVGVLVLIVIADVVSRNFFATSIFWAHDLAVILLVASVWLGLLGASSSGQLVGITVITDRLPDRLAAVAQVIADVMLMLIAAAVISSAWSQVSSARFTKFFSLGWPKWIVAALLGIGMALLIVGRVVDLADRYRRKPA